MTSPVPVHALGAASPSRRTAAVLRFLTELAAWAAIAAALARTSVILAIAAVLVLIALPAVFATPGDKPHVPVAVPGAVTLLILAGTMAGGLVAAWYAWPVPVAIGLTALTAASALAELPRWRWLLTRNEN